MQWFLVVICAIVSVHAGPLTTLHSTRYNRVYSKSSASCKCTPSQTCWPSREAWTNLNTTISGKLISTQSVAISCYPGPAQNPETCSRVVAQWSNSSFQANQPLGLDYPTNTTCPPTNDTIAKTANTCTIGANPVYAVNASTPQDVTAGLLFAARYNIRVVIKTTGHDLLGRSEGGESLLIWLRYMRNGLKFQSHYQPSNSCEASSWNGSVIEINGGYTWSDVYPLAQANNVIVVGSGTPTVSCIGGWMQGGGHGPASRQFGLGADQVLEAQVALANGTIVTTNPCQNPDLFFAIRGGGPGTYGIIVSTTIKAYPMISNIIVQTLTITPVKPDYIPSLLDAISILYTSYPSLDDSGYSGYGSWSTSYPSAFYTHTLAIFNSTIFTAKDIFSPTRAILAPHPRTDLNITESYTLYPDYWTFYYAVSNINPPVGGPAISGSRLFDAKSVTTNTTALRNMITTLSGTSTIQTLNSIELISGGQVFADANSTTPSAVLPAWRASYFNNVVSRILPANATNADTVAASQDITNVRVRAMKDLAPDTGAYMNEADRFDTEFETDFYGANYDRLRAVKRAYDPDDLFYCVTCVGSVEWSVRNDGALCRV